MPPVSDETVVRWELAEELIRRAVARGARFMEEQRPGFLADELDLADFQIHDVCGCVLGQWYTTAVDNDAALGEDPFATACERFDLSPIQAQLLGFDRPRAMLVRLGLEMMYPLDTWWRMLQSEWVSEIRFRQAVAAERGVRAEAASS